MSQIVCDVGYAVQARCKGISSWTRSWLYTPPMSLQATRHFMCLFGNVYIVKPFLFWYFSALCHNISCVQCAGSRTSSLCKCKWHNTIRVPNSHILLGATLDGLRYNFVYSWNIKKGWHLVYCIWCSPATSWLKESFNQRLRLPANTVTCHFHYRIFTYASYRSTCVSASRKNVIFCFTWNA